jgi:hypothetical protein
VGETDTRARVWRVRLLASCWMRTQGTPLAPECEAAGVRAFPTWVINGQLVEGQQTLTALAAQLDAPPPAAPEVAPETVLPVAAEAR